MNEASGRSECTCISASKVALGDTKLLMPPIVPQLSAIRQLAESGYSCVDPVYLRIQSTEAFIADKRDYANLPFPPKADAEICGTSQKQKVLALLMLGWWFYISGTRQEI